MQLSRAVTVIARLLETRRAQLRKYDRSRLMKATYVRGAHVLEPLLEFKGFTWSV